MPAPIAVPSTMHSAIEKAHAPKVIGVVWSAEPNGSPTLRPTPIPRTIAAHASLAAPAATVAARLTSRSFRYGARVAVVIGVVSRVVVSRVVVIARLLGASAPSLDASIPRSNGDHADRRPDGGPGRITCAVDTGDRRSAGGR